MACSTLENISPCNCYMNSCQVLSFSVTLVYLKKITVKTMTVFTYPIIAQNKHTTEEN